MSFTSERKGGAFGPVVRAPPKGWLRAHAALGALLWAASWFLLADRGGFMRLLSWIVLLAILVVTPLALALLDWTPRSRWSHPLVALVHWLQPLAGLLAAASFFLPPGLPAAALALPWAAVSALLALAGLLGWRGLGHVNAHELAAWAAHFFFPFGAAWVVVSQAGLSLPSLRGTIGEPIVILTAVHFHFMGLGLPVLTDRIGRALEGRAHAVYKTCVLGVAVGPPAVAVGFTVHGALQVAGAALLVVSVVGLSVLSLSLVVPRVHPGPANVLLVASALAGVWATPLGFAYTLVQFAPSIGIGIPWMVRFHGVVQAFGLVLCGILGWTVARRGPATQGG
jgi:YndJ-like protein